MPPAVWCVGGQLYRFMIGSLAVWRQHGWVAGGLVCAIVIVVLGDAWPVSLSP